MGYPDRRQEGPGIGVYVVFCVVRPPKTDSSKEWSGRYKYFRSKKRTGMAMWYFSRILAVKNCTGK